jgi:hypothetical protein
MKALRRSFCIAISLLFLSLVVESAASVFDYYPRNKICPSVKCPSGIPERLWDACASFASTIEVLLRGFSLGFGMRMLKYILLQDDESMDRIRDRVWISAVSGLAMAAFIYGMSAFVPVGMRMKWFEYEDVV